MTTEQARAQLGEALVTLAEQVFREVARDMAARWTPEQLADHTMDTHQVAAFLGVEESWVTGRAGRDLPGRKLGRYWRFRRKDVEAFEEREIALASKRSGLRRVS